LVACVFALQSCIDTSIDDTVPVPEALDGSPDGVGMSSTSLQDAEEKAEDLFDSFKKHVFKNKEEAIYYAKKMLVISEEANYQKGIGDAHHSLGLLYHFEQEDEKALEHYLLAVSIRESLDLRYELSKTLNNLGAVYRRNKGYEKSKSYYKRVISIREAMGDDYSGTVAKGYIHLGGVYNDQGNFRMALANYRKALKIAKKIDDKFIQAQSLTTIGDVMSQTNNFKLALASNRKALKIAKKLGDESILTALILNNIGMLEFQIENYDKALTFLKRSKRIFKPI